MTGITFINRLTGASNNLVYLETSDTTATATASGYITAQASNINTATEGGFTWETNDCIMLSASDGISWCSINSTFTTLTAFAGFGSGDVTFTSPSVANTIPAWSNTTGNLVNGILKQSGNYLINTVVSGLTAHASGGQSSATALTADQNNVTTVATAGDSVKLPASVAGMEITVTNSGANSMQVFGTSPDTINGIATGTGVAQAAGSTVTYRCDVAGNWLANISLVKANGTEASNAVTANGQAGVITTSSLTTSGGSSYAITWTNSYISAGSTILLSFNGGTNTTKNITMQAVAGSGSATLTIYNNTAATALNGTEIIGYQIL